MTDVSIIIVSYNTKEILKQCLDSIFQSKCTLQYEVIVIDNNSSDGSYELVKKEFQNVKAYRLENNLGFAKANNFGAKKARGKYLWLLNSDTIINSNTLQILYSSAIKHNSYIASCRLKNPDGSIQPQGGALPNLLNTAAWMLNLDSLPLVSKLIPPYQDRREIRFTNNELRITNFGWLGGTALLVKKDLYFGLGGLDENIFMYGEDVEFCMRANMGGIPVHLFTNTDLVHLGQQSGSSQSSVLGEFRGLKYVFLKHKTKIEYNWLRFFLKTGAFLRVIVYTILTRGEQRNTYVKAFKLA